MTAFDPNAYWLKRGPSYMGEPRLHGPFYRSQERFIVDVVKRLNPSTVLEVGCGYGRVTRELAKALPGTKITGRELSSAQVTNARAYCQGLKNVEFRYADINVDPVGGPFDLAIAIEVLLHHPAEAVKGIIGKLLAAAPLLLHEIDPNVTVGDATAEHCFIHDYFAIYREMGCTVERFADGEHTLLLVSRAA